MLYSQVKGDDDMPRLVIEMSEDFKEAFRDCCFLDGKKTQKRVVIDLITKWIFSTKRKGQYERQNSGKKSV